MESALYDRFTCGGLAPAAGVRVAYSFWIIVRFSCLWLGDVLMRDSLLTDSTLFPLDRQTTSERARRFMLHTVPPY